MNTSYLETFVTVVEKQGLSKAARVLNLTQPAVSKHISYLEAYFGVPLLIRQGKKIELTEPGIVLLRHAKTILSMLKDINEDINDIQSEVKGQLLICASTIPGNYFLPHILGQFNESFPQVRISLEVTDSGKVLNKLLENKVSIGAVGKEVTHSNLSTLALAKDQLVLIVPTDHQMAKKHQVSINELQKEKFVWRESDSGTRKVLEQKLEAAGLSPQQLHIAAEMGSTEAVVNAVEAGIGISIVSVWAIKDKLKTGSIKTVNLTGMDLERNLYLVYPHNAHLPRTAKAFIDFINQR